MADHVTSVHALSSLALAQQPTPQHPITAADPRVVARLVRLRLNLERLKPLALMASLASLLVLAIGVASSGNVTALRALAVLFPLGVGGGAVVIDKVVQAWFVHVAESDGLLPSDAERLFFAAREADHWVGVLEACGHSPSEEEIAQFVRGRVGQSEGAVST